MSIHIHYRQWQLSGGERLFRLLEAFNPEKYGRRVEQANLMDIDPDKLAPAQLDRIAEHLIEKALGNNPETVAEARRRIEAGETVTIESLETPAADPSQ